MIHKIINGKMNEIELMPLKRLNTSLDAARHAYPIDAINVGSRIATTIDISNCIHVWSLETSLHRTCALQNDLIKSIQFNEPVWATCLDEIDKYLFVGLANGSLKSVDLTSNAVIEFLTSVPIGITHLGTLRTSSMSTLLFLVRLNGFIELVEFSTVAFVLLDSLAVCLNAPIINLVHSAEYILAAGQDSVIRVVKLNAKPILSETSTSGGLLSSVRPNAPGYLLLMFELSEHGDSPITAMCLDRNNCINAATGSQNGYICIWNLLMGECTHKLNRKKSKFLKNSELFFNKPDIHEKIRTFYLL